MRSGTKLIIGVTEAVEAPPGVALLQALRSVPEVEAHLVMSKWAEATIELKTPWTAHGVAAPVGFSCSLAGQAATIPSDLLRTNDMVVIPCSTKTLVGIRADYAEGLVGRAADMVLKGGRKLVLVPRGMPLNTTHLENMLALSRMGVAMVPSTLAYYNHPEIVDDITNYVVIRVSDQFGLDYHEARRWNGLHTAE